MRSAICAAFAFLAFVQSPTNDLPNPYQPGRNVFKLPAGRTWGSTSAVDIDKDGKSIWVAERCGVNSCADPATGQMSPLDPVMKFDASGNLLASFGKGQIAFAHGIHVDRDGNIWITDAGDNRPRPARGSAPGTPAPPAPATLVGHQVIKFSPSGKVLMTLGKAGVAREPARRADRTQRRHHRAQWRHLRRRRTRRAEQQRAAGHRRADLEVHQRRQVHYQLGQARVGAGRIPHSARTCVRFARSTVCR